MIGILPMIAFIFITGIVVRTWMLFYLIVTRIVIISRIFIVSRFVIIKS